MQVVNPLIVQLGLDYLQAVWVGTGPGQYPSVAHILDSIAGAPYFNLGPVNDLPNLTADMVLDAMTQNIANMSVAVVGVSERSFLAGHAALANFYGLNVRAYEGGPDTSLGVNAPEPLQAKANASTDPRMAQLITTYLTNWSEYGFGPLNYFTAGAGSPLNYYGYYEVGASTPPIGALRWQLSFTPDHSTTTVRRCCGTCACR